MMQAAAEECSLFLQEAGGAQSTGTPSERSRRAYLAKGAGAVFVTLLAIAGAVAWCRSHAGQAAPVVSQDVHNDTKTMLTQSVGSEARGYIKEALSIKAATQQELADAKVAVAKELEAAKSRADMEVTAAEEKAVAGMKRAQEALDKANEATARHRVCVDLPGTRLKATKPIVVKRIVGKNDAHTPVKCRTMCQQHADCEQAFFEVDKKNCSLFSKASLEPVAFRDDKYNSTYCGDKRTVHKMIANVKKIFEAKPYVPPLRECAWAGDDCRKSKCCANVPVPNFDFTQFSWYSCYTKDKYFAACQRGPAPGGWEGKVLGGTGTREVPKAPKGVLIQPTSLYCIAVVMWSAGPTKPFWDSEGALANNYRSKGLSIMQCDAHDFIAGAALNWGGDGSSINNIDSFIKAWDKVRVLGKYLHYGWTVKVDSDAVFFPNRLKMHLHNLRTPAGSRVYLENINFKFHFMGALEVLSREALETYFEKNGVCAGKVGHQGGEDYYMKSCMDGIGIDHQTDFDLLNDAYAAQQNCNDPWAVAFHFYKKVNDWNYCHAAAQNAWNAQHR